ncbi:hypothetical protein [Rouxiella badensis]
MITSVVGGVTLDTCQFTTQVEADVPRVDCPEYGCQKLPVS